MTEWQRKTPLEWQAFVDKEVKVLAAEKHQYKGWVLTVDPVSANYYKLQGLLMQLKPQVYWATCGTACNAIAISLFSLREQLFHSDLNFFDTTILLANPLENGKVSVLVVLGHAVQDIEIMTERDDEIKEKLAHLFMAGKSQTYNQEELDRKKNSLKNWLEKNHIPVKEQGESQPTLCVAGVLTIDPPYGPEDCNSSNEIILCRVQGLIQSYLALQQ